MKVGAADEGTVVTLAVRHDADVAAARQFVRALAVSGGFPHLATEALVTAVSELASNIVVHAGGGTVGARIVRRGNRRGILVVACDNGPGIRDTAAAMRDGYSTVNSLGLGLPSVRRLVDEFALESHVGEGTIIRVTKWEP